MRGGVSEREWGYVEGVDVLYDMRQSDANPTAGCAVCRVLIECMMDFD